MSTTGKYKLSNRARTDLKDIWRYTLENWKRPCGRHIIFYRILEDGSVLISRILHERMDYKRHL